MERDPVCGMMVDPPNAAGQSEYKEKIYFFCSLGCKKAFDKEPTKYTKEDGPGKHSHHR